MWGLWQKAGAEGRYEEQAHLQQLQGKKFVKFQEVLVVVWILISF